MSDDLYQQAIMDLARRATGNGALDPAEAHVTLDNPLCGDRASLDIRRDGAVLAALAHRVKGCALCKASAAALAESAPGRDAAAIAAAGAEIEAFLKSERENPPDGWSAYEAFRPVREHKSRIDCVLLPLRALRAALGT